MTTEDKADSRLFMSRLFPIGITTWRHIYSGYYCREQLLTHRFQRSLEIFDSIFILVRNEFSTRFSYAILSHDHISFLFSFSYVPRLFQKEIVFYNLSGDCPISEVDLTATPNFTAEAYFFGCPFLLNFLLFPL